jgi:hypothetical protein
VHLVGFIIRKQYHYVNCVQNFIQHPVLMLTSYVEEIIGYYQCGFRRNRATTDHTFFIRHIVTKWEYSEAVHRLFAYLKNGCD